MSQELASQIQIVSQIVQTLVAVIGIPFVLYQIRQQTQAVRLQTESLVTGNLNQMAERFDKMMDTDPELADFYDDTKLPAVVSSEWNHLNKKHRKYYMALGRALSYLEEAFVLWRKGWLETSDYQAILTELREIMCLRIFEIWWPVMKPYYRADFSTYLERLAAVAGDNHQFLAAALTK